MDSDVKGCLVAPKILLNLEEVEEAKETGLEMRTKADKGR